MSFSRHFGFGKKEIFSKFVTFGYQKWVHLPHLKGQQQKDILHIDLRKGFFLGFEELTTRNIKWFDTNTKQVKHVPIFLLMR